MSFKMTSSPKVSGEGLKFINFTHCLQIVLVIGKYTDVFGGDFSGGKGEGAN